MKKYILFMVMLSIVGNLYSQRRKIELHQSDPRFTVWAEAYYNFVNDENIFFYVQNNTNEKYKLEVEVTVNSTCHPSRTSKLGINRVVFLNPHALFSPSEDWVHSLLGPSNAKECRRKLDKDTYTFISGITYSYVSIRNLTVEEKLEAEEKAKKEALELEQKEQKEADALAKKEKELKEAEELKLKKEKEAEELKLKKEKEAEELILKKQKEEEAIVEASVEKEKEETSAKAIKEAEEKKIEAEEAKAKASEEARLKQIEKEEAAERQREEEVRKAQARQQEYDTWKEGAQKDRDTQDALNTAGTFTLFTLLGGFIYEGMGDVDPMSVYVSPSKKFVPKFFFNSDFGLSFSLDPILFQSSYSTMTDGTSYTNKSLIEETGYYLNINAEVKIGAGNDFYSFYGLIGGKFGVVPTLAGSSYAMGYGGGADFGIKNIKIFGQYRSTFMDEKSMRSSDVEENGFGELSALSSETYYGIKITVGGNPDDDFKRSHIYLGMMTKKYVIDGNTRFYDPDLDRISAGDIKPIKGYLLEWRKDHTFKLYFKYYEDYNYIGTVDGTYDLSSSLSSSGSFFEVGFLRSLDFF